MQLPSRTCARRIRSSPSLLGKRRSVSAPLTALIPQGHPYRHLSSCARSSGQDCASASSSGDALGANSRAASPRPLRSRHPRHCVPLCPKPPPHAASSSRTQAPWTQTRTRTRTRTWTPLPLIAVTTLTPAMPPSASPTPPLVSNSSESDRVTTTSCLAASSYCSRSKPRLSRRQRLPTTSSRTQHAPAIAIMMTRSGMVRCSAARKGLPRYPLPPLSLVAQTWTRLREMAADCRLSDHNGRVGSWNARQSSSKCRRNNHRSAAAGAQRE